MFYSWIMVNLDTVVMLLLVYVVLCFLFLFQRDAVPVQITATVTWDSTETVIGKTSLTICFINKAVSGM